ncbi:MAG: hypothetical protein NTY97_00955, partial [Planctomycetota bacterium]|nr:hypothetical protein [Planctomycetota bacterium]
MTNATTMPTMSNMKLPPNLDAACWDQLAPLYAQLTSREIASAKNLEQLILDRSDLDAAAEEAQANLYIAMTCHTNDDARRGAFLKFVQDVEPNL